MEKTGAVSTYVLGQGLDHASGRVHSVFGTSLNIEANGFLLHVGSVASPLSCLGVALPEQTMSELLGVAHVGDLVAFRPSAFRVYARARVVRVELDQLRRVSTEVPVVGESWSREALEAAVDPEELAGGIGLAPSADLAAALEALSQVALGGDAAGLDRAVAFLMGRGLGLTPSGDDILAGFGTALRARGLAGRFDGQGVAAQAASRTTSVSAAYLRAMADGYANEDYVDLVRGLGTTDAGACRGAVAHILAVGHTSGHDSLLGFVAGMGLLDHLGERLGARAGRACSRGRIAAK